MSERLAGDRSPGALRAINSPTLRPGRRLMPELVGHSSEHLALVGEAERALAGRGRMVRVVGEPGVGKSRLKQELYRELVAQGTPIREARASESFPGAVLGVFVELILDWLRSLGAHNPDGRARALRRLSRNAGLSPSEVTLLEVLVAAPQASTMASGRDETQGRQETLQACRALFLSAQRTTPLVLVLEDFHLADAQSFELLLELGRNVRQGPTLIVVLEARGQRSWPPDASRVDVELEPLSALASRKLLRSMLGTTEFPPEVFDRIDVSLRGNPGYLVQMLYTWAAEGALLWDNGSYRFTLPPEATNPPTSIRNAIERRLGRLEPEERRMLLHATVLGRAFWPRILLDVELAMGGESRSQVSARLDYLATIGLLDAMSPSGRVGFVHEAIYDVIRDALRFQDAARVHELAAHAYLHAGDEDENVSPETLAYHWQCAGQPAKAVPFLMAAADRSRLTFDCERASRLYRQAYELLQGEYTTEASQQRQRVQELLADVLLIRGDYTGARQALQVARRTQMRDTTPSPVEEARYLKKLATVAQKTGQYGEAIRLCEQALALVEATDSLQAAAIEALGGLTLCYQARFTEAREWITRGLWRLEQAQNDGPASWSIEASLRRSYGNVLMELGRPEEAADEFAKGGPLCERLGDRWELSIVYYNVGEAFALAGRNTQALQSLERALHAKLAIGDRWGLAYTYQALSEIHSDMAASSKGRNDSSSLSRVDEALVTVALDEAQKGVGYAEAVGDPKIMAALRVTLGRIHLLRGDYDTALQTFEEALAGAQSIQAVGEVIGARLGLSTVHCARGVYSLALHEAETAHRLALDHGIARSVVAALVALGDTLQARGTLAEAEQRYLAAVQAAQAVQNATLQTMALATLTQLRNRKSDFVVAARKTRRM